MHTTSQQLEIAIAHGDTDCVKNILDESPQLLDIQFPTNIGLTPPMWASRTRRSTVVKVLLDYGADTSLQNYTESSGDGGNTALWFTAQGSLVGQVPIAEMLIDSGADLNRTCEHGTTPLFMAVSWVHIELVQYLISRGASPDIANKRGLTPQQALEQDFQIHHASRNPKPEVALLIERAPRMLAYLKSIQG